MKTTVKALALAGAVSVAALLSGCATPFPMGLFVTNVTLPVTATSGELTYAKMGKAKCTSLFGWFAWGDASLQEACKSSGLQKVKYVNYKATNFFGVYGTYTVYVYGE